MKIHPATQYAIEAIERTRVVGNSERLSCLRHLRDLARAGQLPKPLAERVEKCTGISMPAHDKLFPWMFDEVQASFVAIEWFKNLRHIEGKLQGEPIVLIPAHVFDISCMFGWTSRAKKITRADGRKVGERRFRKALITEGRKNAKTTRLSGISLYLMVGDNEYNPKVYCAAVDKGQARELYDKAKLMAETSPDILSRLKVRDYMISHKTRGGKMAPLSKDTKNKDGLNPSGATIDEYAQHPTSEIYDLISSAKGQRLQPLMTIITTAGSDVDSPYHAEYEYGKLIISGQAPNDRYFVMIRELDDGDDEQDLKNWIKANPLLGSSEGGMSELKDMYDEAFGSKDVAKVRTFRIKNLNIWVHGNESSYMGDYMIGTGNTLSKWDQLAVSRETFLELTNSLLCVVGVDLSKKIDLTALAYIFALKDGRTAISAHGFMPEAGVVRHEKTDRIPYRNWAKDGWVTITEGDVVDYNRLMEQIELLGGKVALGTASLELAQARWAAIHYAIGNGWQVHEICYDPYNATQFKNDMDDLGYTTIEVRQTMPNLNEPTKLFRDLVASGMLVHDGSPLLRWCVGNAKEIVDSKENIMISKKKAKDSKRVDLLAAGLDGLFRIQPLREATSYTDYVNSDDFGF
jgi:phage terminase large subunit-like protein